MMLISNRNLQFTHRLGLLRDQQVAYQVAVDFGQGDRLEVALNATRLCRPLPHQSATHLVDP
jgi:hypothetical protein